MDERFHFRFSFVKEISKKFLKLLLEFLIEDFVFLTVKLLYLLLMFD